MNNFSDLDDLSTVHRRKSTTTHKKRKQKKKKNGCAIWICVILLLSGISSCFDTYTPDNNTVIEKTTTNDIFETSYAESDTTAYTDPTAATSNPDTEPETTTEIETTQTEPVTTIVPEQDITEPSTDNFTMSYETEAVTEATIEPSTEVIQNNEPMVWISETGSKYHRVNDCGKMNPDRASQISLSQAQQLGYDACSKCY